MITVKSEPREIWDYLSSQGYRIDEVGVSKRPVFGHVRISLRGEHQAPAAVHITGLFEGASLRDATARNNSTLVLIPVH